MQCRKRLWAVCLAAVVGCSLAPSSVRAAEEPYGPFLGAYVHFRDFFSGKDDPAARESAIAANLDQFRDAGLRVVIPFVTTTGGQADYPSQVISVKIWGGWDPLAVVVREAHRRGLQVYPVMCVLACGDGQPQGILAQHPEWALRDKQGKPLGFISAGNPQARKYVVAVLTEIAAKYHPDGILLDYCRYPGREASLDPVSQAKFDEAHPADKFPRGSRQYQEAFRQFKCECLNGLVGEISAALRALHPRPRIAAYMWGVHELKGTRDWRAWAERGYIDSFNLTGYYYAKNYGPQYLEKYADSIRAMAAVLNETQRPIELTVCVGISTSHGRIREAKEIDTYLQIAKRCGVKGAAFFTWGTLKPYLAEVKKGEYLRQFESGLRPPAAE
jgi:uncharacterized lipoprotein YddW (UPF0748 family)